MSVSTDSAIRVDGHVVVLLPDHRVLGANLGQPSTDCLLHRAIGLGHGSQVGLGLDQQVLGAVAAQRHLVRQIGQLQREREILRGGGHVA
jgi:hypothetical protein